MRVLEKIGASVISRAANMLLAVPHAESALSLHG